MVPVMGATAPPWAPAPLTAARYFGTGTDTCELPSCRGVTTSLIWGTEPAVNQL